MGLGWSVTIDGMHENPYRSPTTEQNPPGGTRFRRSWAALALRAWMAVIGAVVVVFGALVMLRTTSSDWFIYPAAVCLVGGGACLIWWAFDRR
jgi:dolichyl-phosphate-mannose--protein O-mannosyl transferase